MENSTSKLSQKKDSKIFDQQDWASAYCNVEKELNNIPLKVIRGEVPPNLSGIFYRNGPGRLERNNEWVHHPFDGDGMIVSFKFQQGNVLITNRFVRTAAWVEEEKARKFLFRGVFGTQKAGGILNNAFDLRLKNIANTHVIKLGNDLLALWEAAGPHALNPETLETKGLSTLNGVLKQNEPFSAHPRFDPGHHGSPRMVAFGVKTGPKSTIRLMEFITAGKNAGKLINERKDTFKGFAFLHDFAITPNWAIFLQNAISFNPLPFILGQKGAAQCLSSQKNMQGRFLLIPRESGSFPKHSPRIINAPKGFVFHHLNAWENKKEIILESIYYKDFPSIDPEENFRKINFDLLPEGILKRCKINLSNNQVDTEILSPQCSEFAMVNPLNQGLNARYSWMATAKQLQGNAPLQSIKKLDLINGDSISWSASPRGFVSEPQFVAKPNTDTEDEGWIIVLIWNGEFQRSELIIIDSQSMNEIAALELPIVIPYGLHGSWVHGS